jgi:single stranded DNA-binding protein
MDAYQVTGRLTRDPDLRSLPDGGSVCKIRLAVDGMGRRNSTGYIDVTSFGKPAEAAANVLRQGWLVAVSGRLEYAEWEAAGGGKRSGHQVVGHVEFLRCAQGRRRLSEHRVAVRRRRRHPVLIAFRVAAPLPARPHPTTGVTP